MLHMMLYAGDALDTPFLCFFQPVGEGAILIDGGGARLTANGQMFAMMRAHCGGELCALDGAEDYSALATVKDGLLTLTLINDSFDEEREFSFDLPGVDPAGEVWTSEDVAPYSVFVRRSLEIAAEDGGAKVLLPPHSAAKITLSLGE